jgi:hypothetical protein
VVGVLGLLIDSGRARPDAAKAATTA